MAAAPPELAGLPEAPPAVHDAPDLTLARQQARGSVMRELQREADQGMRAFIAAAQEALKAENGARGKKAPLGKGGKVRAGSHRRERIFQFGRCVPHQPHARRSSLPYVQEGAQKKAPAMKPATGQAGAGGKSKAKAKRRDLTVSPCRLPSLPLHSGGHRTRQYLSGTILCPGCPAGGAQPGVDPG